MYILKKIRLDRNLSVCAFADMLDIKAAILWAYENRSRTPSTNKAYHIMDKLKDMNEVATLDELCPREEVQ